MNEDTVNVRASHLADGKLKTRTFAKQRCRYVLTAGPRRGETCGLTILGTIRYDFCVLHRSELFR